MIRYGTRGRDNWAGTSLDDFLYGYDSIGGPESDTAIDELWGLGGDDHLYGGGGADLLHGGGDNDTLQGGSGGDWLDGGTGSDTASYTLSPDAVFINLDLGTAFGGDAEGDTFGSIENVTGSRFDDVIVGDDGDNVIDGWSGHDTLAGGDGQDHLYGGFGIDILWGQDGEDILDGGYGDDFLHGGSDDDVFIGSSGADLNDGDGGGGLGRDLVDYSASPTGVTVNLATGTGSGGFAAGDRYVGIEDVTGSAFPDTITGNSAHNALLGGGGDDVISGGDGNDLLIGGAGADVLDGGLHLGPGGDRVSYEGSSTGVWVDLAGGWGRSGDAEGDKLWRIEDITGSREKDVLFGDNNDNTLEGGAGDDELHGGAGYGGDILIGGSHDDRLWGDAGPDDLWGGSGADRFMYASVNDSPFTHPRLIAEYDTIYDFVSGVDKIDLSAIDANTTSAAAGDQRFILTLRPEFGGAAGLLRIDNLGDGTATVYGETTGDGVADLQIVVFGHVNAGDIIM